MLKQGDLEIAWDIIKNRLHTAVTQSEDPFRLAVLSTVTNDQPTSRYVVLRNVKSNFDLFFYTDLRSSKVSDLKKNPKVSLLLFDPNDKIQITIKGNAHVHHRDDVARQNWQGIPAGLRKPYASIISPGTEFGRPQEAHVWPEEIGDDHFTVVRVIPGSMEVLEINGLSHFRARFTKQREWRGTWLAP